MRIFLPMNIVRKLPGHENETALPMASRNKSQTQCHCYHIMATTVMATDHEYAENVFMRD